MALPDPRACYVLRIDAVRWAVETLAGQRTHEFFPAYLHLRAKAIETGSTTDIHPDWRNGLGTFLEVRGGPHPYFRPFLSRRGTGTMSFWLNVNLAGSFAPSSIRTTPRKVIEVHDRTFDLKPNHAQLAREFLLYDTPVSAIALAMFYYRDFGLITDGALPKSTDLIDLFRRGFRFSEQSPSDDDFDLLFEDADRVVQHCFEPFTESEA